MNTLEWFSLFTYENEIRIHEARQTLKNLLEALLLRNEIIICEF